MVGSLVVEIRRGGRRIGCWQDPALVIEPGDRLLVIDSDVALQAPRRRGDIAPPRRWTRPENWVRWTTRRSDRAR